MNERSISFGRRVFTPLLLLGMADRLFLLFAFGFKYVGDDEGVIWSAAVDYGHGLFREPYFYGQDYAAMLEALVAAPFARLGVPLHILMPTVTSLLALVPFWSFAFWHRKHDRPLAALIFLVMPVLLPVEYGIMTTITRCFISGIAPLAFVPWVLDLRNDGARSFFMSLVLSAAAFINPNSLVFSIALFTWYLSSGPRHAYKLAWSTVGTVPFMAAYLGAQSYCQAHPERMMHLVNDWRMTFHGAALIPESLGMLNLHFAWLFPLLPSLGGLDFATLMALIIWNMHCRDRTRALALACSLGLIIFSFAFPKTHDGTANVFYAYSRMYLALPLLLCWGIGNVEGGRRAAHASAITLLCGCMVSSVIMVIRTPTTIAGHMGPDIPLDELPIKDLREDAKRLCMLKNEYGVDLVVGNFRWKDAFAPQFRCYLYPALEPTLSPTYLEGGERRYWQRDAYASHVVPTLLILGGDSALWAACMHANSHVQDLSDKRSGQLHLIRENTEPTDSLMERLSRMQAMH